jgi:hypothetical protein
MGDGPLHSRRQEQNERVVARIFGDHRPYSLEGVSDVVNLEGRSLERAKSSSMLRTTARLSSIIPAPSSELIAAFERGNEPNGFPGLATTGVDGASALPLVCGSPLSRNRTMAKPAVDRKDQAREAGREYDGDHADRTKAQGRWRSEHEAVVSGVWAVSAQMPRVSGIEIAATIVLEEICFLAASTLSAVPQAIRLR